MAGTGFAILHVKRSLFQLLDILGMSKLLSVTASKAATHVGYEWLEVASGSMQVSAAKAVTAPCRTDSSSHIS